MTAFDMAVVEVLEKEGLFSDHASDSGGATRYGITEEVARANGYNGDMRDLPKELAVDIYLSRYWLAMRLEDISRMSYPIALELFDSGVNAGTGAAGKWLQRCLNVLNQKQLHYQDLKVDGAIGDRTLMALTAYLKKRGKNGEVVLLRLLNALQGHHYVTLAESREKDEDFVYGWAFNRLR